MGVYAVTGAASGMGSAVAARLRAEGHQVIGIDIREADIVADLSVPEGRRHAAQAVLDRVEGHLDGAVLAAGLGPRPGFAHVPTILSVNYFGVTDLLTAWRPALETAGNAKVVVVGSNSTTTMPMIPQRAVRALLRNDLERATRTMRWFGPVAPSIAYGTSKMALTRWVRRTAVQAHWAGAGIRLNAIAPGAVDTPLLRQQLDDPREAKAVRAFPVPVGHYGSPTDLGAWMAFMLSDAADFICGSVIVVDGGTDAYYRADAWPRRVPTTGLPRYLWRTAVFARRRSAS